MTPKEKAAEELVDKFLRVEDDTMFYWEPYYDRRYNDDEVLWHAKRCALIVCDELIAAADKGYDYDAEVEIPFLEEVKKEIKKL